MILFFRTVCAVIVLSLFSVSSLLADISWNIIPHGSYTHIAHNGSRYVAVGEQFSFSFDGKQWVTNARLDRFFGTSVRDLSTGNGVFVAIAGDGRILRSTDGSTWTRVREASDVRNLVYARGSWWAFSEKYLYTSPDALTWTRRLRNTSVDFSSVAFFGARFYGVRFGKVWRSDNGLAWSEIAELHNTVTQLVGGDTRLLAYGQHGFFPDQIYGSVGGDFVRVRSGANHKSVRTIIWDGQRFVGYLYGDPNSDRHGKIITSVGGSAWNIHALKDNTFLSALHSNGTTIIGVGEHGAITSIDTSFNDTLIQRSPDINPNGKPFIVSHYEDGQFWGSVNRTTYKSPKGKVWTRTSGTIPPKVIAFEGRFYRLNGTVVEVSIDRVNWQQSLARNALSLASSGAVLVAGGAKGVVYTLRGGTVWQQHTTGLGGDFRHIYYTHNRFFGYLSADVSTFPRPDLQRKWVGDVVSSDGINWSLAGAGTVLHDIEHAEDENPKAKRVAWSGQSFTSFQKGDEILETTDGINWSTRAFNDSLLFQLRTRAMAEDAKYTVAVGDNLKIYYKLKSQTRFFWKWPFLGQNINFGAPGERLNSVVSANDRWVAAGTKIVVGADDSNATPPPDTTDTTNNVPIEPGTPPGSIEPDTPNDSGNSSNTDVLSSTGSSGGGAVGLFTFIILLVRPFLHYKIGRSKNTLFQSCVVITLLSLTGCGSADLTRQKALQLLSEENLNYLTIAVGTPSHWDDAKKLIKNKYLYKTKFSVIYQSTRPTKKLLPFYMKEVTSDSLGKTGMENYHVIVSAKVATVTVSGIQVVNDVKRKVGFTMTLEPNEIGALLAIERDMQIFIDFELFDDGWRAQSFDRAETVQKSPWVGKRLANFVQYPQSSIKNESHKESNDAVIALLHYLKDENYDRIYEEFVSKKLKKKASKDVFVKEMRKNEKKMTSLKNVLAFLETKIVSGQDDGSVSVESGESKKGVNYVMYSFKDDSLDDDHVDLIKEADGWKSWH